MVLGKPVRTQLLVRVLAIVLLNFQVCVAVAQEAPEAKPAVVEPSPRISIEQIERSQAELEQSTEVPADIKLEAAENYRAAAKNLQSAADSDARLQVLISATETVAARAQQLQAESAALEDKKPTIEPGLGIQALEQLLPTTELQLSSYKKARQDAETDLQTRAPRRKEIRARLATIQEKLADASAELTGLASAEPTPKNLSLTARLLTRKLTLEKEKPALEAELAKFDAEEAADLTRLRIEVAASNASQIEKHIALLQKKINVARENAAEESVKAAKQDAINADPALKVYADQNQQLAESAKQIAESLAETAAKLNESNEVYDGLVRQFAQTKKKVDSVGLSSSVGALLRKQKMTMPDVVSLRDDVASRQQLINDTQYQLFEREEAHQALAEIDVTVEHILAEAEQTKSTNIALLESAALDLMKRKREYLDDLVHSTGQYFDTLIELDTVEQQVIALEAEYKNYIDERVLWIRSGPPLTAGIQAEDSDAWMLSPTKWNEVLAVLIRDAKDYSFLYLMCLAIVGLWLFRVPSLRRSIIAAGELAAKSNCRSMGPTLRGLGFTSILSLATPLLCTLAGWRLVQSAGQSEFTGAVGQSLQLVGVLWGSIELIRQICRPNGIGVTHFRWSAHATGTFRREVKFGSFVALPIFFVSSTLALSNGIHERSDIQRIAFILGMCVVGFYVFRLLRPAGIFREYFGENASSFSTKFKILYPIVGVGLCLSLVVLAATGYFFTAQILFWRLFATCMFVAALLVVRAIFFRMLLLKRRQLSIEQSRERAAAARLAGEGNGRTPLVGGIATESQESDISAHSLQSRRLVSAATSVLAVLGLWMIWIQVLPALSMIGDHPLWGKSTATAVASISQQSMSPIPASLGTTQSDSAPSPNRAASEKNSNSVTLSDLALAILFVIVTIVLFRNGPGLLEMSVLQQLPMDASVRYGITTLVSYVIVMFGTIASCSAIGLQWSQIQWLATALTFGLAFGLQEMFANFVAGLIILIERPVRVGDVVTVDDVTGVVSRIRIRATSITNWDRKEYVVPNKEFITGKLLNWTLSDKVNRIVVPIGLAYGSDTERARELLLLAANEHPVVLKDPAAIATFEGFGDSSLNLVLRAFLPSLENRLQIIHELHTAIDKLFREAKIEIAFPQRDLHIRSMSNAAAIALDNADTVTRNEIRDAA